jgi:hypothetical protein
MLNILNAYSGTENPRNILCIPKISKFSKCLDYFKYPSDIYRFSQIVNSLLITVSERSLDPSGFNSMQ